MGKVRYDGVVYESLNALIEEAYRGSLDPNYSYETWDGKEWRDSHEILFSLMPL